MPHIGFQTHECVVQARSQAVEAQLASTTAELKELKARQHQLEVRNMLLEKVSQLNKSDAPQVSEVRSLCKRAHVSSTPIICTHDSFLLPFQDGSAHDTFDTSIRFEDVDVDNVNVLTISVQGKQYSMTPHEVSQMPLQSFSALWTVSPDNSHSWQETSMLLLQGRQC